MTDILFDENSLVNPFEEVSTESMTGEPANTHEIIEHAHVAEIKGNIDTGEPDPYYSSSFNLGTREDQNYDVITLEELEKDIEENLMGLHEQSVTNKPLEEQINSLVILENQQKLLEENNAISKDTVIALESIFPGLITDKIPLTGFTTVYSKAGLSVSTEAITERMKEIISKIIKAIKESINNLLSRFGLTDTDASNGGGYSRLLTSDYDKLIKRAAAIADIYGNDVLLGGLIKKSDPIALKSSTYKDYVAKSVEATFNEYFAENFYLWFKLIVKKPDYYTHIVKMIGLLEKAVNTTNNLLNKFKQTSPSDWDSIDDDDFYKEIIFACNYYHKVQSDTPSKAIQEYRTLFREEYRVVGSADGFNSFHAAANFRDPFSNVPGLYQKLTKEVAKIKGELSNLESQVCNGKDGKPHTGSLHLLQRRVSIIGELDNAIKMHHDAYRMYYRKLNLILIRNKNMVEATNMLFSVRKNTKVVIS